MLPVNDILKIVDQHPQLLKIGLRLGYWFFVQSTGPLLPVMIILFYLIFQK
jgi:hypothetical protein